MSARSSLAPIVILFEAAAQRLGALVQTILVSVGAVVAAAFPFCFAFLLAMLQAIVVTFFPASLVAFVCFVLAFLVRLFLHIELRALHRIVLVVRVTLPFA